MEVEVVVEVVVVVDGGRGAREGAVVEELASTEGNAMIAMEVDVQVIAIVTGVKVIMECERARNSLHSIAPTTDTSAAFHC